MSISIFRKTRFFHLLLVVSFLSLPCPTYAGFGDSLPDREEGTGHVVGRLGVGVAVAAAAVLFFVGKKWFGGGRRASVGTPSADVVIDNLFSASKDSLTSSDEILQALSSHGSSRDVREIGQKLKLGQCGFWFVQGNTLKQTQNPSEFLQSGILGVCSTETVKRLSIARAFEDRNLYRNLREQGLVEKVFLRISQDYHPQVAAVFRSYLERDQNSTFRFLTVVQGNSSLGCVVVHAQNSPALFSYVMVQLAPITGSGSQSPRSLSLSPAQPHVVVAAQEPAAQPVRPRFGRPLPTPPGGAPQTTQPFAQSSSASSALATSSRSVQSESASDGGSAHTSILNLETAAAAPSSSPQSGNPSLSGRITPSEASQSAVLAQQAVTVVRATTAARAAAARVTQQFLEGAYAVHAHIPSVDQVRGFIDNKAPVFQRLSADSFEEGDKNNLFAWGTFCICRESDQGAEVFKDQSGSRVSYLLLHPLKRVQTILSFVDSEDHSLVSSFLAACLRMDPIRSGVRLIDNLNKVDSSVGCLVVRLQEALPGHYIYLTVRLRDRNAGEPSLGDDKNETMSYGGPSIISAATNMTQGTRISGAVSKAEARLRELAEAPRTPDVLALEQALTAFTDTFLLLGSDNKVSLGGEKITQGSFGIGSEGSFRGLSIENDIMDTTNGYYSSQDARAIARLFRVIEQKEHGRVAAMIRAGRAHQARLKLFSCGASACFVMHNPVAEKFAYIIVGLRPSVSQTPASTPRFFRPPLAPAGSSLHPRP